MHQETKSLIGSTRVVAQTDFNAPSHTVFDAPSSAQNIGSAYDGSNAVFKALQAFGWRELLNLGYFPRFSVRARWALPRAQEILVRKGIELLELEEGNKVLDVACGRGKSSSMLAHEKGVKEVVGIDFLPQNIQFARTNFPRIPNLSYRVGDATKLSELDFTPDRIMCVEAAFHFDRQKFLEGAYKILAPGGQAVVIDFMWKDGSARKILEDPQTKLIRSIWQWNDFSTVDEYRSMSKEAGFEVVAMHDWTNRVIRELQFQSRIAAWLGSSPIGRWLINTAHPRLRNMSDADWREFQIADKAHRYVSDRTKYMALVLKRPA